MFATHAPDVRAANLSCLQVMLGLWDALDEIETQASRQLSVHVRRPLKTQYDLECFIKTPPPPAPFLTGPTAAPTTHPPPAPAVRRVTFRLRTPEALTLLQSLPPASAALSLQHIERQLREFFVSAGVAAIKTDAAQEQEQDGKGAAAAGLWGLEKGLSEASLDAILFDRAVQRAHAPVSAFSSLALSSTSASKRRKILTSRDVESYVKSGNLLVRGLSPEQEFKAVERLKEFLRDYGMMLNFSLGGWRRVVLVLVEGGGSSGSSSTSKKVDGYMVSEVKGVYVVEVPIAFKTKILLESLRTGLGSLTSLF